MGQVREVYYKLLKIIRCKNCGQQVSNKITSCESGHTVCEECYESLQCCTRCNGVFLERYLIFYNKVMAALNDKINYLDKLYDMIECPVCYECLSCPSWTCWNGHLTCGRCYFYTSKCPLCREEFTNLYNTDLNILLSVLESPMECINKPFGCEVKDKYTRLKQHEKKCSYKQYKCLIENCEFTGLLSKLSNHVYISHSNEVIKLDRSFNCSFEIIRGKTIKLLVTGLYSHWLIIENNSQELQIKLIQFGYQPVVKTAVISLKNSKFTIPILPISELDSLNSVYTHALDQDCRTSKTITCSLTVNSKTSSWFVNTMFVAALAANLTFAVIILKNIK